LVKLRAIKRPRSVAIVGCFDVLVIEISDS
jgi:hypothetical protein